jgi:tetratricopeptide (TPR) repeat protein
MRAGKIGRGGLQLCLFAVMLLSLQFPIQLFADQTDDQQSAAAPVDYDAKIEKRRSAYQLFPMNEKLKRNLAEEYANYGYMLLNKRQYEQADEYLVKALELYPEDNNYTLLRGICTYLLKKYDVARYELDRAVAQKPDSIEALYYLGLAMYDSDSRFQAVELWERALKLSPGRADITSLLNKARKEMAVESAMDRGHSSRFNVTYDPDVNATTAQAILDVLESASNQIGAELGHFPEARVPVAIYKRDDYKTVTASPDWSGGVYDGTIRLPFGSISEVTAPLRAILFHEYAHVIVYDLTHGNCPLWLNEGIAEFFGNGQLGSSDMRQKQPAVKRSPVDLRTLEGNFSGLSTSQASAAYQNSYSVVNYLVTVYGWHRIKEILTNLGKGMKIDAAIAETLNDYSITYEGLIKEWNEAQQGR